MELATPRKEDLEEMLELERQLTDRQVDLDKFSHLFEKYPELYVVCRQDGKIIGEASGELKDDKVLLESIAIKEDFRGQGLGNEILEEFLERSKNYSEVVSVASARDTEGFYKTCGFEPEKVLLQASKENLTEAWRYDKRVKNFRDEGDDLFIYLNTGDYSEKTLEAVKEKFNAHSVNTILERTTGSA